MLWIWDIKRNCLSASFTFATPIVMFNWSPQDDKLAVVTSNQTLYLYREGRLIWSLLPCSIYSLNSIRYVGITNLKSVEWNALGKTLLFIGDDCFQVCNVIFVVCYEILWVVVFYSISTMEEVVPTTVDEIKDFSFDSSQYELIAQGAEGVYKS